MDPLFMQFLQNMQGTSALQPGFDAAGAAAPAAAGGGGDLAKMLSGIKAPEAQRPVFSGGVSGTSLPFLQQMPNLLNPALQASQQRIGGAGQVPSLGQILAGSMR